MLAFGPLLTCGPEHSLNKLSQNRWSDGPPVGRSRSTRRRVPATGAAKRLRPSGDDRCRLLLHPSPEAVGPASRLRRRYANAPAATLLLTGLGVGERRHFAAKNR